MDLSDNILLRESFNHVLTASVFLLLTNAAKSSTCTQTHKHTQGCQTLLIPVLDSRNGTGTKVILHLPLFPLSFHLLLRLSSSTTSSSSNLNSLKRMYLVPKTRAPEKKTQPSPATWAKNGSNQPIQRDWRRPQSISEAPVQLSDSSWWRTWSEFKGGWTVRITVEHGKKQRSVLCHPLPTSTVTHSGNIYTHQDDPGNTFLYMKPCVGNLSAWVSALEKSNSWWAWNTRT